LPGAAGAYPVDCPQATLSRVPTHTHTHGTCRRWWTGRARRGQV